MTAVDILDPEMAEATVVMTWKRMQICQQMIIYLGVSLFRSASIHGDDKVGGMCLHLLVIQHTDRVFPVVLQRNRERGGI
jgi:hypothetical protein